MPLRVLSSLYCYMWETLLFWAKGMQLLMDTIAHGMSTDIRVKNLPGEESLCNVIKLSRNYNCLFVSHDNGFICYLSLP